MRKRRKPRTHKLLLFQQSSRKAKRPEFNRQFSLTSFGQTLPLAPLKLKKNAKRSLSRHSTQNSILEHTDSSMPWWSMSFADGCAATRKLPKRAQSLKSFEPRLGSRALWLATSHSSSRTRSPGISRSLKSPFSKLPPRRATTPPKKWSTKMKSSFILKLTLSSPWSSKPSRVDSTLDTITPFLR